MTQQFRGGKNRAKIESQGWILSEFLPVYLQ